MSPVNGYVTGMGTEETRRRIVEAVVGLHEEVGPAATTITAVAERAGVQRLTVYRHFPGERDLIQACSAHWSERHPAPDPSRWSGIQDPERRCAAALEALYAYFRKGMPMLANVLRDVEHVPPLEEVMRPWREYLAEVAGGLAAGWGGPRERQRLVRAVAGHAVRFETWRSLADEGLDDGEAAALVVRWIRCTALGEAVPSGEGDAPSTG